MGGCRLDRQKLSLHHADMGLFHSSQWSPPPTTTPAYVAYRLVLAGLMVAGVIMHMCDVEVPSKWLIYMTNQGILLLTIHYVLYAGIVTANFFLPRGLTYTGSLPFIYKLSWALQNMTGTVAVFITLIYWTLLHPIVIEENLMPGAYKEFLNVFLHLLNSVSFLIDIFVTARPTRIHHFYFAIMFGLWYMAFSLVYWAAGGTGRCYCNDAIASLVNTTTAAAGVTAATPQAAVTECVWYCDSFIYPILDWGDHPGLAVAMIAGGVLAMPLVQTLWWLCYKLRLAISRRFAGRRSAVSSQEKIALQDTVTVGREKVVVVK